MCMCVYYNMLWTGSTPVRSCLKAQPVVKRRNKKAEEKGAEGLHELVRRQQGKCPEQETHTRQPHTGWIKGRKVRNQV